MEPPPWHTPFRVGESWSGSFHPLIALHGLDIAGDKVDGGIWELLNIPRNPALPPPDFAPNYFILDGQPLPPKKPKREGLELSTYVPSGLLPSSWADKHRQKVPAVLVAFFKDAESKEVIGPALANLRNQCSPHGTQLLVMLIKGPGEEELSTERATALCASADIPPKSLYILSTAHPDRVHPSVMRLEGGIKESAKAYYALRVRRLKANKERCPQSSLQLRYNLKLAFFHEVRRDFVSAMSHYESSVEGLWKLLFGGGGGVEALSLLSLAAYRLLRLHLVKREWGEAKGVFSSLIATLPKALEPIFLRFAFLEHVYHNFGELAKQFYRGDSNNAVDPVPYFITASKYAQKRALLVASNKNKYEAPWEDFTNWEGKFIGQRPWSWPEEGAKLPITLYYESLAPHSDHVINHLGVASEFCKDIGRLRTRCQLMSMMGEEFKRVGEYSRATLLMGHVLREFGGEGWGGLVHHAATVGLDASAAQPSISGFLSFSVLLLKRDLASFFVKEQERKVLATNLEAVIRKKPPNHPCADASSWLKAFESEELKSYVGVHSQPFLEARIGFGEEIGSQGKTTPVNFHLTNHHFFPIHIKALSFQTNVTEYDGTKQMGVVLAPGENYSTSLELTPFPRDSNKVIQLQVGVVDIGLGDLALLLHYPLIHKTPPTLWGGEGEASGINVLKVEPAPPLLQCNVEREETALVGEAHKVTFIWTNKGPEEASKVTITFFLSAPNPQLVRLSPDPSLESGGGLSHSVELESLEEGGEVSKTLYIRATAPTDLRLISKAKWIENSNGGFVGGSDSVVSLAVTTPFGLSTHIRDTGGEALPSLAPLQPFVLNHTLTNLSPMPLHLHSITFSPHSCLKELGKSGDDLNLVLKGGESVAALQLLQLLEAPPPTITNLTGIFLNWSRPSSTGDKNEVVKAEHWIGLPRIFDEGSAGLYLTAEFGPGRLKRPMSASYILVNRGESSWDLNVSMDSTEYFMNAGPKKVRVKVGGSGEWVELAYILFPLKAGLVSAPKLIVEGLDPDNPPPTVYRDLQKSIFIMKSTEEESNK